MVSSQSALTDPIYVSVGDVTQQAKDFKGAIYYISGSENCFSYYILDGKKHLTLNTASLDIEINPSKAKQYLSNHVEFSIALSCVGRTSLIGSDLFTDTSCIKAPDKVKFLYEANNDCFFSNEAEVNVLNIGSGKSQYKIECKTTLFDIYEPSLCDYFSYYSNSTSIVVKALFEFEITDEERAVSILEQLSDVMFYTDLPEKQ